MAALNERIREIQEHVTGLSSRVNDFLGSNVEPNLISRFKRKILVGPVAALGVKSFHSGAVQGFFRLETKDKHLKITLIVDDLLDAVTANPKYQLTNLDLKIDSMELLGLVHQKNGIVLVEKMILEYDSALKRYTLAVLGDREYPTSRLLIVVSLDLTLNDYSAHEVNLLPLPVEGPGSGGGSRPGKPGPVSPEIPFPSNPNQSSVPFIIPPPGRSDRSQMKNPFQ